jgi:CRP-like cAMP-binding protein
MKFISSLSSQHNFPRDLEHKIFYHFQGTAKEIESSIEYRIDELILDYLPTKLQTELMYEVYSEPIKEIPFFQDRDTAFYLDFIMRLIPSSFFSDTYILRKGTRPEEVFFILSGEVENSSTNRIFSKGAFFGERDIIKNNKIRQESFRSITSCYLLSLAKEDF